MNNKKKNKTSHIAPKRLNFERALADAAAHAQLAARSFERESLPDLKCSIRQLGVLDRDKRSGG